MTPTFTCVVTCKARLAHLRESLPPMAHQPEVKVVVVDYGCPEQAAQWVRQAHPTVQVLQVTDDPGFHLARARNLGAAQADTPWLAFLDADMVPAVDFFARLAGVVKPGHYHLAGPAKPDTWGSCILPTQVFHKLGGYDEAITGYGGEDNDLYDRLEWTGLRRGWFPVEWLRPLGHDDALRTRYHANHDLDEVIRINHLYRTVKMDLLRLGQHQLDLPARQRLRGAITQAVKQAVDRSATLMVPLPRRYLRSRPPRPQEQSHRLETVLRYEVLPPTVTPPAARGDA